MSFLVNETPVKTSKNYHINNLNIPDFQVPTAVPFANCDIRHNNPYCKTVDKKNLSLDYGMNPELLTQSSTEANVNLEILLEENQVLTSPVCVVSTMDGENPVLIDNIHIVAKKNAKATVIIKYYGKESPHSFYKNTVLTAELEENATVNVTVLNLLPYESHNFFSHQSKTASGSHFTLNLIDFGAKYSVGNLYTLLAEEKSQSDMNVIYIGKDQQVLDYNLISRLQGKRSVGNIEVQGVLDDKARKSFKGTLDFLNGASHSIGYENEFCTMLSENCGSIALPMLLCQEEEVEGSHSSGSGKLDEEVLFYIESRGIPYEEARKLIVKANFYAIIQNVPCEDTKNEIMEEIERRIT